MEKTMWIAECWTCAQIQWIECVHTESMRQQNVIECLKSHCIWHSVYNVLPLPNFVPFLCLCVWSGEIGCRVEYGDHSQKYWRLYNNIHMHGISIFTHSSNKPNGGPQELSWKQCIHYTVAKKRRQDRENGGEKEWNGQTNQLEGDCCYFSACFVSLNTFEFGLISLKQQIV